MVVPRVCTVRQGKANADANANANARCMQDSKTLWAGVQNALDLHAFPLGAREHTANHLGQSGARAW